MVQKWKCQISYICVSCVVHDCWLNLLINTDFMQTANYGIYVIFHLDCRFSQHDIILNIRSALCRPNFRYSRDHIYAHTLYILVFLAFYWIPSFHAIFAYRKCTIFLILKIISWTEGITIQNGFLPISTGTTIERE